MGSNTAIVRVGHLVEIRASAGYRTASDVDALFDQFEREIAKLPPPRRHVTAVDWRHCPVMSPEAAERIARRIALANATTVRSAALAAHDSPVAVLQFLRVIRQANLPDRRLFFESDDLIAWLDEVLSIGERARLREFIAEGTVAE